MKPEPARLSVVVPFYGVEAYIEDCLSSIQRQRFEPIEVIMVDDGSPDGSRAIAERFANEDDRFKLVTQANAGLGPARNTGVGHANAEYITFIDSDDLVTRTSFERMIHSLDESGSSFCAGNARRFNNTRGVKPSWAHLRPFAHTVRATHIYEMPVLARDRMVWNKVYRRSFWDEFAYEFPPIRYEDYPVTLKAHIDAVTVDILATPIYYWRERESGDSITQQVFKYDNLLDRVESATMVLDMLDGQPAAVQKETRLMLAESDYISLVQAFANAPAEQLPQILELSRTFVERLGEDALATRSQYDKLQLRALELGDLDLLRELAQFRGDGGLRGGIRATPTGGHYEFPYPGRNRYALPRELYRASDAEIGLRTAVDAVQVDNSGAIAVEGVCEIRHIPTVATDSTLRIFAVNNNRRVPLTVERFDAIDSHGDYRQVGFRFVVPPNLVEEFSSDTSPMKFDVSFQSSGKTKLGLLRGLRPGSATWPRSLAVGQNRVMNVTNIGGALSASFRDAEELWTLTHAQAEDGFLNVEAVAPNRRQRASFTLPNIGGVPPLAFVAEMDQSGPTTRASARIPLSDVLARTVDDDPYLASTTRNLFVTSGGRQFGLKWQAPRRTVSASVDGHLFRLTRAANDWVTLRQTMMRVTADSVTLNDSRIVVEGRCSREIDEMSLQWRRYLPNSDQAVRVDGILNCTADTWTFETEMTQLFDCPTDVTELDPLALLADWTLFVSVPSLHLDASVMCEPFLMEHLPLRMTRTHDESTLQAEVRTHAETLHVQIQSLDAAPTSSRK